MLDSDSGFVQVLTKRLEAAGWQYRVLASPVPLDQLIAMYTTVRITAANSTRRR